MKVTVQVKPDASRKSRKTKRSKGAAPKELLQAARELGVELKPMHPGEDDPELASYFTADVADADEAARVAEHLRRLDATEAAYVKPEEEMP